MNQQQLIDGIAAHHANTGVSKATIKFVLEAQGDITQLELVKTNEVTLPGIGKFSTEIRAARIGRNPATGAALDIPAKRVVKFSPAKALKDVVADYKG